MLFRGSELVPSGLLQDPSRSLWDPKESSRWLTCKRLLKDHCMSKGSWSSLKMMREDLQLSLSLFRSSKHHFAEWFSETSMHCQKDLPSSTSACMAVRRKRTNKEQLQVMPFDWLHRTIINIIQKCAAFPCHNYQEPLESEHTWVCTSTCQTEWNINFQTLLTHS